MKTSLEKIADLAVIGSAVVGLGIVVIYCATRPFYHHEGRVVICSESVKDRPICGLPPGMEPEEAKQVLSDLRKLYPEQRHYTIPIINN